MLCEKFLNANLKEKVTSIEDFTPFPKASDRIYWSSIPEELSKPLIKNAEKYLNYTWPPLTATMYMEFVRNGSYKNYDTTYLNRRTTFGTLVIAECIEGNRRFMDDIINGIWCICEESHWVGPMHNWLNQYNKEAHLILPTVSIQNIDLRSAETGALLVWTYYLLKAELNKISPIICQRIKEEVKKRILAPYLNQNFWWMDSVCNWNPWITSNCLTALLILEENESLKILGIEKAMRTLDKFILAYNKDGGCDEGTSYWDRAAGSLFECLQLLYMATEGFIDIFDKPLIKNLGAFIYKLHIADSYFINFADGGARVDLQSVLTYSYGKYIQDEKLCQIAAYSYKLKKDKLSQHGWFPMMRMLSTIKYHKEMIASDITPPLVKNVWLEDLQVMAARMQSSFQDGLYLAAKGGNNNESHNHNDVGQYIIYFNGKPVIIDIGVEYYNKKTFGPDRYDIWTMRSSYHNLPTINGIEQKSGEEHKAFNVEYSCNETYDKLSMDIANAYPSEAGVDRWIRTMTLDRSGSGSILIEENFKFKNINNEVLFTLMTPCKQTLLKDGVVVFRISNKETVSLKFPNEKMVVSSETITITDSWLNKAWGDSLYRVLFTLMDMGDEGTLCFEFK